MKRKLACFPAERERERSSIAEAKESKRQGLPATFEQENHFSSVEGERDKHTERKRERGRKRQSDRKRERERQTYRKRKRERESNIQKEREINKHTEREREM